ncbi:hypothetical protein QZH41_002002 [Actinostola sp. cb2023]|nr:hypothetical protein QZH41_002002 [Actinostola sp. cb2023]
MDALLKDSPQGLIKFQLYSKKDEQRFHDRRLNRVKNKNSIPLGPWAHTVVVKVMKFSSGTASELAVIGENLRVFRILRSLKMVSRFAQLRIIVLTILKAFKSMAFIMILLITFMYIFAVAGTVIFDSYSKSNRTDLKYKESFRRSSSTGYELFKEGEIKTVVLPTLAEVSDAEENKATEPEKPEKFDPFAALGTKMAKLSYDDKWVSVMERPKACGDHPIRFYSRDSGLLKFKIHAGFLGRPTPPTARRLVAFTFHPHDPFAISVQRTNAEYVVNFHIRHLTTGPEHM